MSEYISGDVEFCFYRREAREVFLCGDFNGWGRTALPMAGMDGGWWKCRLRLASGSYQFKYLADGEWYLDYAAFGIERGPLGAWNSVILVRARPVDDQPRRAPAADVVMPSQRPEVIRRPLAGSVDVGTALSDGLVTVPGLLQGASPLPGVPWWTGFGSVPANADSDSVSVMLAPKGEQER